MRIEVLVVPDCPNEQLAVDRLRRALGVVGLEGHQISTHVITEPDEAERRGFTGSPTILIDGHDPFAEPGRPLGLACRVYRTPDGYSGVPDAEKLCQALTRAAEIP